jgi:ParB family chromosome partitioning protein
MNEQKVLMLPVDEVYPNLQQPRKSRPKEEQDRMAATIAKRGVLQPIRVRWDESRGCWEIVTGESRWRAAKQAGLTTIPSQPVAADLSEADLLAEQLIENVVRNDLSPLDLSRGLAKYKALGNITAQQMAAELGMSGGAISKAEALLSLPEDVQALVDSGRLKPTVAYDISRLPDPQSQRDLAHAVASGKVSTEGAADAVQAVVGKRKVAPRSGRVSCKVDGVSVSLSAAETLTWAKLYDVIGRLRSEARKLEAAGKEVTELARQFRAS